MLGSVDFVGPRRLLRVFKECKVFGLKLSWKEFPKEGDLPGRGPESHWLSPVAPRQGAVWSEGPSGHPETLQMSHEKASIWTPEAHPWT